MRSSESNLRQFPTGIAGLDILLRGGFVVGGVYLVLGNPGTGKTTLGNNLAYNVVKQGGTALYVTVVAETHDRMLNHLAGFEFLDLEQVGERIHYLSVYDELMEHGLDGVQTVLRRAIRERGYDLLVIDGASVLEMAAASHMEYSRFISDLSAQMGALGCISVLLAMSSSHSEKRSIAPYVDGILELEDRSVGLQDIRYIHTVKMRGVELIRGRHRFTISTRGIEVFPRLETVLVTRASDSGGRKERVSTGIPGLDDILHGGLLEGSTSLVRGPAGIGKTILGLQFILEGARRGESCIIATFLESSQALSLIAEDVSEELNPLSEQGLVHIYSTTDPELPVDDWAWKLLEYVDAHKPERILIDGASDVSCLRLDPNRRTAFFRALISTLTSRGITVMFTAETNEMFAPGVGGLQGELATMSDVVLLMHYVQVTSRLHRVLSVVKVRGAAHDQVAREFSISRRGIELNMDEDSAARILTAAVPPTINRYQSTAGGGETETVL